jgi:anti-anti-sigma factor
MYSNKNFLTTTTTTTAEDGTIVVAGDIDMAGGAILEQAMAEREVRLAAEEGGDLAVDLAAAHFIDSSGLRSLLTAARRAAVRHAHLELRSVGPEIIRLFEITGTMDQFSIVSRRD